VIDFGRGERIACPDKNSQSIQNGINIQMLTIYYNIYVLCILYKLRLNRLPQRNVIQNGPLAVTQSITIDISCNVPSISITRHVHTHTHTYTHTQFGIIFKSISFILYILQSE